MRLILLIFTLFFFINNFIYGQFPPPYGIVGSTAIHKDTSIIVDWATSVEIRRGWQNISDTTLGKATFGADSNALNHADYSSVSLGDGGIAVLQFAKTIKNGIGFDFCVFENGFSDSFLELAFVEVSSDGVHYVRFPSLSYTPLNTQIGPFDTLHTTQINNLAGKYKAGFGTPFDLEELRDSTNLDINSITHIRLVDVVGSINEQYGNVDSQGNLINDPWPTPFASSGFDLDAVGVMNNVDNVVSISERPVFEVSIYPNPIQNQLIINTEILIDEVSIFDARGRVVKVVNSKIIDVSELNSGIYFCKIGSKDRFVLKKIIKN